MEKLRVNLIIEILGRPPENVTSALNSLIEKLGNEKGVKILNKHLNDPVPVKDSDLFTAFVELNLELDSLANYLGIVFAYLPSHIELASPEKIILSNVDLNDLANVLTQRLHNYDAIARKMLVENEILLKKLQEIAPHLFQQMPQISQTASQSGTQAENQNKIKSKKAKSKTKK